ncbi:hypothetical protein MRX96_057817 [Rhipicephalus microplus]
MSHPAFFDFDRAFSLVRLIFSETTSFQGLAAGCLYQNGQSTQDEGSKYTQQALEVFTYCALCRRFALGTFVFEKYNHHYYDNHHNHYNHYYHDNHNYHNNHDDYYDIHHNYHYYHNHHYDDDDYHNNHYHHDHYYDHNYYYHHHYHYDHHYHNYYHYDHDHNQYDHDDFKYLHRMYDAILMDIGTPQALKKLDTYWNRYKVFHYGVLNVELSPDVQRLRARIVPRTYDILKIMRRQQQRMKQSFPAPPCTVPWLRRARFSCLARLAA